MKFIEELDVNKKMVFLRGDLNVPIKKGGGDISDDTRIRSLIPTIKYLLNANSRIVIASHLGRPKGVRDKKLSLEGVGRMLSLLLEKDVTFVEDCIGDGVKKLKHDLRDGEILILENLRFYNEETKNTESFAKELAQNIDVFINDAFGSMHRAHASVDGITKFVDNKGYGYLVSSELKFLNPFVSNPKRPSIAILGGAKVSDKIKFVASLLKKVDKILIGGAMAYTFLKAKGIQVGNSIVDDENLNAMTRLIESDEIMGQKLLLPIDHIIAKSQDDSRSINTDGATINEGYLGFDIGKKTIELFKREISNAKTIFANGPLGLFENEKYSRGTIEILKAVGEAEGTSVIGGGDTISASKKAGVYSKISFVSTGGGATLEFIEKDGSLPGLMALG